MPVTRFGVSLEEEFLAELYQYVSENSFANQSQAIRYLIEKNWKFDNLVAGSIVMVYP